MARSASATGVRERGTVNLAEKSVIGVYLTDGRVLAEVREVDRDGDLIVIDVRHSLFEDDSAVFYTITAERLDTWRVVEYEPFDLEAWKASNGRG